MTSADAAEAPVTKVLLIRHGEAGRRQVWTAPDHLRPLTDEGRAQAEGLVAQLGGSGPGPVLTSPFVRCVQSVEPLAGALGVTIEQVDWLAEGAPPAEALALLEGWEPSRELAGQVVYACTHGDVIEGILDVLAGSGVALKGRAPPGEETRKGATWELECSAGRVVSGRLLPPPA